MHTPKHTWALLYSQASPFVVGHFLALLVELPWLRWESPHFDDNSPTSASSSRWLALQHLPGRGPRNCQKANIASPRRWLRRLCLTLCLWLRKQDPTPLPPALTTSSQCYCFQKINKDVQEAEVRGDLFNYSPQSCPSNLLTFRPDLANPRQILIYQLKQGLLVLLVHGAQKDSPQQWRGGRNGSFDITFCCTHVRGASTKWKCRSFNHSCGVTLQMSWLSFVQPVGTGPGNTVARD